MHKEIYRSRVLDGWIDLSVHPKLSLEQSHTIDSIFRLFSGIDDAGGVDLLMKRNAPIFLVLGAEKRFLDSEQLCTAYISNQKTRTT